MRGTVFQVYLEFLKQFQESIMHLLETVTQVKEHYEHLRKELSEVQTLQKQVQASWYIDHREMKCNLL